MPLDDTLERLIEANVAAIPWSALSPLGVKTEKRLTKTMHKYLATLYKTLPVDKLAAALHRAGVPDKPATVTEAVVKKPLPEAEEVVEDWLMAAAIIRATVLAELADDFTNAAARAALAVLNNWGKEMGVKFAGQWGEGNMAELAQGTLDWAREYGGELITNIDETTRQLINDIVASGLDNQDGVDGIKKAIEEFVDNEEMTAARARMIARTESGNAVSEGAYRANAEVGASEKEWIWHGGNCPSGVCPDNEAEGRIPIDDAFSSGDLYPTAHPNCMCAVVYFGVDIDKLNALGGEG